VPLQVFLPFQAALMADFSMFHMAFRLYDKKIRNFFSVRWFDPL
jgi:hypothetical protein